MQTIKNRKKLNFYMVCLIFFIVMAVYLFTLAPTITMEDSGELVTAAYTLGIAHPPGFPIYVILGKLFTFIPLGTIAWRVNLMSAVFGALTISLLYLIIDKLTKNRLISFCFSLVLAFSPIFWSQSVIAEVYTLNTFFICLLILILLVWSEKRTDKYLFWFSFLYGLALTNHTASLLLAPAFSLFIILVDRKVLKKGILILKMFLLFLLGLSVYLYLPLRAWQEPIFNWGPITSWSDVIDHISRTQYGDFGPLVNTHNKTGVVISFFVEIYKQFFLPTLILAFGGAVYLWRKNRSVFVLTVGIFLLNSLGIIYLRQFGWSLGIEYIYRVYYLPGFLMITIWLSLIINYLYKFLIDFFKNKSIILLKAVKVLFFLVLISLPVSFAIDNYKASDMSGFWLSYDYAKNLLTSLEPDSIYYFAYDGTIQGDTEIFSILYLKLVENFRPDVVIISEQNFFNRFVHINLPDEYHNLNFNERRNKFFMMINELEGHPLYTNFAVTQEYNDFGFYSLGNGYAFKIYPSIENIKTVRPNLYSSEIRNSDQIDEFSSYSEVGLVAHYYYNLAHFYLVNGQKDKSQRYLIKAFNLDTAPLNHEYVRFMQYRSEWKEID